ncbi:nicotinate (nicotinamide) nucleotide adenylyltransferase [Anaerococcus obesiensis]|uniref:Probable nicotinate-nucleotide adenylyltransferase n=1 Tax=Anaerococcus obesiensis TaxID=1287640 RepID=A0A7T7ZV83_9FIRM|nr:MULTISPECIES: nicotinate (nicotinamide) nucleotide adenylyltransferase [Anaerococcus]MBS4888494.1 nicotinate (nicotinamide) nucleotide adenylyltransferase [Anaerococcus vaginalis]MDD7766362.1 nicotinate (nicotinamide) nucleotide adenylyltransferase [Anaerococcus vaginalis]MDU1030978.1 nicotinate (nicotinamide) nucleotide adenylyltransferase [Anaerococcus vaginalis]MDU4447477.1 nicotinate (nicotinamide) nucleotide adenylyltransferase [Anaerococcus vaginalis]MDU5341192.1 nicotinate (nicotinam
MKIGLFGGTFDPIHIGHMILMENVINNLDLDKIYVLPNSNPPHKLENKKTALNLRLKMVNETIKDNPKLEINDYDYRDNEIHYTFNTINYFKKSYPNDEFFFIMGEDSFLDIEKWKNYKEILKENLIIFKRYSNKNFSLISKINQVRKYNKNIYLIDNIALDISSTLIRNLVKENKSIRYLVNDEVINIIKEEKLYV